MENSRSTAYKYKSQTNFDLHKKAHEVIAQGYLTNSKRPEALIFGVYPTHLKKGLGSRVWDYQGKSYIDYITGLGTNLIGYANATVTSAVIQALMDGNLLSLGSEQEIKTASKLKEIFPWVDCWKFLKSGSEACSSAVRIARTYTKRTEILSEGYHGWSDGFVSLQCPTTGTPSHHDLAFFDLKNVEVSSATAAVIVEPIITDISRERLDWLRDLKEQCQKVGALLIFDEVITGFRFPKHSASAYFGIEPDLIVIGKAMSNGLPLAAVGGKYHVMNTDYFVSSTYAGAMDALLACEKVVELTQKNYKLEELWAAGADFVQKFNELWPEMIVIEGYPTRGVFKGNELVKALLFQEACYAGILLGPSWFFNFPLMNETFFVLGSLKDIIYKIKSGDVKLEGEMPKSPFSAKVRGG